MQAADESVAPPVLSSRLRLDDRQINALRRLVGRWLLERDGDSVYWCAAHGRRLAPYFHIPLTLFESLHGSGLLVPIRLSPGRQHYTISDKGDYALRAYSTGTPVGHGAHPPL